MCRFLERKPAALQSLMCRLAWGPAAPQCAGLLEAQLLLNVQGGQAGPQCAGLLGTRLLRNVRVWGCLFLNVQVWSVCCSIVGPCVLNGRGHVCSMTRPCVLDCRAEGSCLLPCRNQVCSHGPCLLLSMQDRLLLSMQGRRLLLHAGPSSAPLHAGPSSAPLNARPSSAPQCRAVVNSVLRRLLNVGPSTQCAQLRAGQSTSGPSAQRRAVCSRADAGMQGRVLDAGSPARRRSVCSSLQVCSPMQGRLLLNAARSLAAQ